jgi:hypothetical protein
VSLLTIIVVFVVVGVLLWLINQFVPMDPRLKNALSIIVVVLLVLWVLMGVLGTGSLPDIRVGG